MSNALEALVAALSGGANSAYGAWQNQQALKREDEQRKQAQTERDRAFGLQKQQFDQQTQQQNFGRAKDIYNVAPADHDFSKNPEILKLITDAGLPTVNALKHTPGSPINQPISLPGTPLQLSPGPGQEAPTPPSSTVPMTSPVGGSTMGSIRDVVNRAKTPREIALEQFTKAIETDPSLSPAMRDHMKRASLGDQAGVNVPAPPALGEGNIVPDPKSPTGFSQILYDSRSGQETGRIPAMKPNTPNEQRTVGMPSYDEAQDILAVTGVDVSKPDAPPLTAAQINAVRNYQKRNRGVEKTGGVDETKLALRDRVEYQQSLTRIQNRPEVKDYREMGRNIGALDSAMAEAKTSGSLIAVDQALINSFNKLMDPSSVVRESEYARTAQDQSIMNYLKGKMGADGKWARGGAGLTAQDRQAIATMARKFVAAAKTRNDEAIEDIASANDVITTATGESLGELIRRGANPKPKKEEEFDLDLSKGDSGTTTPTKPTTPKPAGSQFIMRSGGGR